MNAQDKRAIGYVFDLSKGKITKKEIELRSVGGVAYAYGVKDGKSSFLYGTFMVGKNWFPSADEALKAAEAQRQKRLASLKKQVAKMERMTFKEVE